MILNWQFWASFQASSSAYRGLIHFSSGLVKILHGEKEGVTHAIHWHFSRHILQLTPSLIYAIYKIITMSQEKTYKIFWLVNNVEALNLIFILWAKKNTSQFSKCWVPCIFSAVEHRMDGFSIGIMPMPMLIFTCCVNVFDKSKSG